jgi:serine/threonine protein kinase/uncharacterized membrane protein YeaQ/YmgE (transglycosylase-associated protein family)
MAREQVYLLGAGLLALLVLGILITLLSNLVGLAVIVALGCGLGMLSESIYPSPYNHGRASATGLGLAGACIGSFFLGHWGPALAGVSIVPSLLGALSVSAALRGKVRYDRIKALEDYQASGDDPMLMSQVEQYRLIRLLGRGGFAKVYQAVPDRTLRESESVAIKVFSESALQTEGFFGRVEREVALCQKLDHPNIVHTLKADEQNKVHYIIMEYVAGETLRKRMQQGRLEITEAVQLITDMASALGHAHAQGVIHRDIKPDNILLSDKGPKIMDFGLARLEGTSDLTQSGSAIGTPHYMAPEQVLCEKNLDGRCDQYALGCMAFEMLTGEKLFDGEQAVFVVMKHVNEAPRNPRDIRPQISEALAGCILRMVAKKADDRYPTMEALVSDLKKIRPEAVALTA